MIVRLDIIVEGQMGVRVETPRARSGGQQSQAGRISHRPRGWLCSIDREPLVQSSIRLVAGLVRVSGS